MNMTSVDFGTNSGLGGEVGRVPSKQADNPKRWRAWAIPFLSLVVVMGLLTSSQSHLTAYEEKRAQERREAHDISYAALNQGVEAGNGLYIRQAQAQLRKDEAHLPMEPSEDIIRDIVRLAKVRKSPHGRPYRSLICALSRNDVHLREYVVRNLLAGFAHVVIYDNNQVGKGMDHDTRSMLQPFVDAKLVTHVPWDQNADSSHLENDKKNHASRVCLQEYGPLADWVSVMDTDEVFYLHKKGFGALGAISEYLDDLEVALPHTCATSFPWRMMYSERRVLKPPGLLMDAHHRVCKIHDATKMLFRPEWSEPYNIPHFLHCTNPNGEQYRTDEQGGNFGQRMIRDAEWDQLHLVHYYAKSVEEWLTKLEQSIPPYIRYLPDSYDHVRQCLQGLNVTYPPEYEAAVHDVMTRLWATDRDGRTDGGVYLGPAPEFAQNQLENYNMYLFFKLRVAMRDEWDEEAYLAAHADVADAVERREWVDGLQHFLEDGFRDGRRSCWLRRGTIRFCI